MLNALCPNCGAVVPFKSHASLMAVCEYCKTNLLRDADSVQDIGRMSAVLEDYSPIQIGTAGQYGNTGFTVIGRIQLKYAHGLWNEWYLLSDDGRAAWLGESGDQFTLSFEKESQGPLPAFDEIAPSRTYRLLGQTVTASDVRTADCIGGQGELPFLVGQGWQAKVADFRKDKRFLTLDYSESDTPRVYAGGAVTLDQLKCQLLRDDDTIRESSGKIRGKLQSLGCPSCGTSLTFVPGSASQLVHPACRAQINAASSVATVLEAGHRVEGQKTTLSLGAKAAIDGRQHVLVGLQVRRDEEGGSWTEYLMHNPRYGFVWLIETDEGWSRSKVLHEWPEWNQDGRARLGNETFNQLYDYTAETVFAAGAFNWRVQAGDRVRVIEFANGKRNLSAELGGEELAWSLSVPVPPDQIRAWFGAEVRADKLPPRNALKTIAKYFIYGLVIVNAVPLSQAFSVTWHYVLFAAAAIYLPALFLHEDGP